MHRTFTKVTVYSVEVKGRGTLRYGDSQILYTGFERLHNDIKVKKVCIILIKAKKGMTPNLPYNHDITDIQILLDPRNKQTKTCH